MSVLVQDFEWEHQQSPPLFRSPRRLGSPAYEQRTMYCRDLSELRSKSVVAALDRLFSCKASGID